MSETLDYLRTFAAFPFALRRFLAPPPLTLAEAQRTVRERLARRAETFLALVERGVYGRPRSPYLALLKHAGCEMGDLRALVREQGLEGALRSLRAAGVYVVYEELKGRKPIERPGLTLAVRPRDFDNPATRSHVWTESSGSTGAATAVGQDLAHLAATAPQRMLSLAAHGVLDAPAGYWSYLLPGLTLRSLLQRARFGMTALRWFCPVGPRESKNWLKYNLGSYYMIFWMRAFGMRVPPPEFVRFDQAVTVARWIHETVQQEGRCLLLSGVSRVLRVCVAARETGLDLTGATLRGGGEPLTPAKHEIMRQSGARHVPGYGVTEAGTVGEGCADPHTIDDVHLCSDGFALVTHPHEMAGGQTVPAFCLTSLLPTAPRLLLNAQIDDYGVVEERDCGCDLGAAGYTTHLRAIRSYSKLVSEGATLLGDDMLRILEEVLPARFGGSPLDYQLVEEEEAQGFTRLYLVISPRVEIANEGAVIEAVLGALRASSSMADAARTVWQGANSLQVRRAEPVHTATGKVQPLHVRRAAQNQ